ncbi:MAG: hypothetical protein ABFR31_06105 [Thermodesulfobacteriota bacterium]
MLQTKKAYVTRSPIDRRTRVERRILNMGPGYQGKENREYSKDRRRGWEDRYGWERISKWSSSPIYSDLP